MATQTLPTVAVAEGATTGARRERLAGFDGLRALAALAVLIGHFGVVTQLNLLSPLRHYLGRLDIGVPVFFVISGFLLYRPFVDSHLGRTRRASLRTYLKHRALRIYPAYWLALIGALLIVRQPRSPGDLLSWFTLIHLYWPGHLPAGLQQSWSLAVEVSFYALLPAWAWFLRRRAAADRGRPGAARGCIGLAGFVAVSWAYRLLLLKGGYDRPFGPLAWLPAYLDQFAFGMLLALVTAPAFRQSRVGQRTWAVLDAQPPSVDPDPAPRRGSPCSGWCPPASIFRPRRSPTPAASTSAGTCSTARSASSSSRRWPWSPAPATCACSTAVRCAGSASPATASSSGTSRSST